jgi:hypothetical protein
MNFAVIASRPAASEAISCPWNLVEIASSLRSSQ